MENVETLYNNAEIKKLREAGEKLPFDHPLNIKAREQYNKVIQQSRLQAFVGLTRLRVKTGDTTALKYPHLLRDLGTYNRALQIPLSDTLKEALG